MKCSLLVSAGTEKYMLEIAKKFLVALGPFHFVSGKGA